MNSWINCYKNGEHKNNIAYPESFVVKYLTSSYFKKEHHTRNGLALDLGCGFGRNMGILTDNFDKVIGIDPSEEAIEHIRKRYHQTTGYTFIPPNLPEMDRKADLILGCNSIYYLGDFKFEDYFQTLTKAIRSKGFFIFSMIGDRHDCLINGKRISENIVEMNNSDEKFKSRLKTLIYQPKILSIFDKFISQSGLKIIEKGEIMEKYSLSGNRHLLTYFCQKI